MRGIFRGKLKDFKEHVFHESKTRTLFERLQGAIEDEMNTEEDNS